jgi:hypothetical protein
MKQRRNNVKRKLEGRIGKLENARKKGRRTELKKGRKQQSRWEIKGERGSEG